MFSDSYYNNFSISCSVLIEITQRSFSETSSKMIGLVQKSVFSGVSDHLKNILTTFSMIGKVKSTIATSFKLAGQ